MASLQGAERRHLEDGPLLASERGGDDDVGDIGPHRGVGDFKGWYSWAIRCRLEPMKRVARMIKTHLDRVRNAIERGVTNARLEASTR